MISPSQTFSDNASTILFFTTTASGTASPLWYQLEKTKSLFWWETDYDDRKRYLSQLYRELDRKANYKPVLRRTHKRFVRNKTNYGKNDKYGYRRN